MNSTQYKELAAVAGALFRRRAVRANSRFILAHRRSALLQILVALELGDQAADFTGLGPATLLFG